MLNQRAYRGWDEGKVGWRIPHFHKRTLALGAWGMLLIGLYVGSTVPVYTL